MPSGSSIGWFGWHRNASLPGSPMSVLQYAWCLIFCEAITRSMLDISLAVAAIISLVKPRLIRVSSGMPVEKDKMYSRSSPTVQFLISL